MNRRIVLIVDDDASHRRMLSETLESTGYATNCVSSGEEAIKAVASRIPDLVLLDIRMPGLDGMEVLRQLAHSYAALPVVMITAHGDVRTAVEAMKVGARDFLEKPVDIDELRAVVIDILDRPVPALLHSDTGLRETAEPRSIVGVSDSIRRVRETVRLASTSSSTVLIRGESGTGKELVARAIHDLSPRANGPFVAVNCAAIAEGVLESEIFGHERGAFTGANARRKGRFEIADGGTIFLDEIAEMQPQIQVKLLRVLQERSFERVGSNKILEVDIRVVAATNRDLEKEISAGAFREDLFFRLAVLEIVIPPLRERPEDILPTAQHLLIRLTDGSSPRFSDEVSTALLLNDWPGNVRELSNVLERGLLFAPHGEFALEHLPPRFTELLQRKEASLPNDSDSSTNVRPGISLKELERDLIVKTLQAFEGNRTRTAEALGLSRRALLYKLKRYDIQNS